MGTTSDVPEKLEEVQQLLRIPASVQVTVSAVAFWLIVPFLILIAVVAALVQLVAWKMHWL